MNIELCWCYSFRCQNGKNERKAQRNQKWNSWMYDLKHWRSNSWKRPCYFIWNNQFINWWKFQKLIYKKKLSTLYNYDIDHDQKTDITDRISWSNGRYGFTVQIIYKKHLKFRKTFLSLFSKTFKVMYAYHGKLKTDTVKAFTLIKMTDLPAYWCKMSLC